MKRTRVLSSQEVHELNDSLQYFSMEELRELCGQYSLPSNGNKVALINRIITFIQTGAITQLPVIPEISRARRGQKYELKPDTVMLYGSYKNDAKTRSFFKSIIGDYFHFTAYGIDWLNERWFSGNPPTYSEFAEFWKNEYAFRTQTKVSPKKEWAYINFTQRFLQKNPLASRVEINEAWQAEKRVHIEIVKKLLGQ